MLEIAIVYLLARHNGRTAEAKGRSGGMYRWGTAGLWFGGEILGAIAGVLLLPAGQTLPIYLLALSGAILGGVVSYAWALNAPAGAMFMTPPMGLPAWTDPNPSLPPYVVVPPSVPLSLQKRSGDWALVRGGNGWSGWVDARALIPRPDWPSQG
jgi:hypothetical protein